MAEIWHLLQWAVLAPFFYVAYVLLMAGVLAICGASRDEIKKWALKQADRQRFTDLVSAWRRLPPSPPP